MQAAPTPILRTGHQIRTQRIPFDVAAKRVKVVVLLDRERLKPPLIHVSAAGVLPVRVPTLRVRQRQPARESRQFPILARPHHEVPMVGEHTVSQQPRIRSFDGLGQHTFEGFVVALRSENRHSRVGAVENVVY